MPIKSDYRTYTGLVLHMDEVFIPRATEATICRPPFCWNLAIPGPLLLEDEVGAMLDGVQFALPAI
jgi:hypothetical protein